MNRSVVAVLSGVVVMLVSDAFTLAGAGGGASVFVRLMAPVAVYALCVGLFAGEGGWRWAALGVGAFALADSIGEGANPRASADPTYLYLLPWTIMLAVLGEALRRQRRDAEALKEITGRLLSANAVAVDEDLPETLCKLQGTPLDDAVLSEGGLLRAVLREDNEAAARSRLTGYAVAAGLMAAYVTTGNHWLLIATTSVFVTCVFSFVWAALASGPNAFETLVTGYYELATIRFAEAVRQRPLDIKARIGFGLALLHVGRNDQAMSEFAMARRLGLHRFSIGVWIGIERASAVAAFRDGRYTLSARALRTVLSVFPHHASTHHVLAACHERAGQARLALDLYRRAAELGSDEAALKLGTMPDSSDESSAAPAGTA